jgi:hypothetical protein
LNPIKLNHFYPRIKKVAIYIFFLLVLFIVSMTFGIMKPIYANSNYHLSARIGSQVHQIEYCNLQLWKETINTTSDPSDWFPGGSNQTGTQSNRIIKNIATSEASTSALFWDIYLAFNIDFFILQDNGYGSSYLRSAYDYYYYSWRPYIEIANFKNLPFEVGDNWLEFNPRVLYHPENYSRVIANYNNFTTTVNNDPIIQSLNFSLPVFNGDDFLMYLVLNELVIASPINNYLNELIYSLGCENTSVQGNSLILNRTGVKNYQIKIIFNAQGLIDNFTVTTANGILIFKITSWYPADIVIYIFWDIMIGLVALMGITFWRWRKRTKFFKEN